MKINIIMPGLGDSGGIKVVQKYAELFNSKDVDTVIYCPIKAYNLHRYGFNLKNLIHQFYCTMKTIMCFVKNDKNGVKWVWSINNKSVRDADATIATMWATAFDVTKLKKSKGVKYYFIQGYEVWDNKAKGLESYKLSLNKIVISTWINNQIKSSLDIGPFPIVMNGIDVEVFNNPSKRYKNYNEPLTILMMNHLLEVKGVNDGLKVIQFLHDKYPNFHFKMFGICDSSNLPSYINYLQNPSMDELKALYCESDVFIFPSISDGWGLTPIEAMASKCAVVGTNTGFVLDIGKDSYNMMISEVHDVNGMINNIEKLIVNRDLLKTISENGMIEVQKLSWISSANTFIRILSGGKDETKD